MVSKENHVLFYYTKNHEEDTKGTNTLRILREKGLNKEQGLTSPAGLPACGGLAGIFEFNHHS